MVCSRAYHALFMRNMLIRPSRKELEHFHPDYTIYNAGSFPANRYTTGMTSATSVSINLAEKEMVILGTEYAGEMKKGVFTIMFYEMPVKYNVLTLHSSANEGKNGDVTVFFGLSGTGKTTLSADPHRALIGDDEHCWSDHGVFNIEGGCYAKTINLSAEREPDIYNAIRYGSILENVVFDDATREVNYDDVTLTENTRCAYPIEYIDNAKIPCMSEKHPTNIILLTCDARGILPPISKLNPAQVMFHFISGYTSKMAGTEVGVDEPQATFSSCFAQPFLALHPMRYARMLADKIEHHKANAWLLNTGWVGAGATKGGKRCPLKYTRAILDSIHAGELAKADFHVYDTFNLQIPKQVAGVPDDLLDPAMSWMAGPEDFRKEVSKLAGLFNENFAMYADQATDEVIAAGPKVKATGDQAPVANGDHSATAGLNGDHASHKAAAPTAAQSEGVVRDPQPSASTGGSDAMGTVAAAVAPVPELSNATPLPKPATEGMNGTKSVVANGNNQVQEHEAGATMNGHATTTSTTADHTVTHGGPAEHITPADPKESSPAVVGKIAPALPPSLPKTATANPIVRVRQGLVSRGLSNEGGSS